MPAFMYLRVYVTVYISVHVHMPLMRRLLSRRLGIHDGAYPRYAETAIRNTPQWPRVRTPGWSLPPLEFQQIDFSAFYFKIV